MNDGLFRNKSLERVSSPEQLNDYIRVASPGVWMILAAVIILLAGIIVWGIFGTVNTSIDAVAITENGHTICYAGEEEKMYIEPEQIVEIGDTDGTVKTVFPGLKELNKNTDSYLLYVGDFSENDKCCVSEIDIDGLEDGIYPAKIIIDSVHPITYILR